MTRHEPSLLGSLGLMTLRAVVGAGLILHGLDTLFGGEPAGSNLDSFVQNIVGGALHVPQPELAGKLAKWVEVVGGGLLVLGLLSRLAALLLVGNMGVALYFHIIVKGQPFFVAPAAGAPSWELPALYFAGALAILCCGGGKISIDSIIFAADKTDDGSG